MIKIHVLVSLGRARVLNDSVNAEQREYVSSTSGWFLFGNVLFGYLANQEEPRGTVPQIIMNVFAKVLLCVIGQRL